MLHTRNKAKFTLKPEGLAGGRTRMFLHNLSAVLSKGNLGLEQLAS